MAKSSDLILMVLDASKSDNHRAILTRELNAVGARGRRQQLWCYGHGSVFRDGIPATQPHRDSWHIPLHQPRSCARTMLIFFFPVTWTAMHLIHCGPVVAQASA